MMRRVTSGVGSFLQTPFGVLSVTTVVFHGILLALGMDYTNPFVLAASGFLILVDFAVAFSLIDRMVYFFSQFVLPVNTPKDRQEIYARVSGFDGRRGPTVYVKNGRVIRHEGEMNRQGPGVIVLDTASAVVLQTDTAIIGPAGPGIRFTSGREKITTGEGVDLRTQWQFIGPQVTDQPFLNNPPISEPKKYNETQARRQATAGHTRDGFEISATISIKFRIKRPEANVPSESGVVSRYGYNAEAVLNAITSEVIELGTAESKRTRMDWHRLPAHLVVNLWREYVRKFKLGDLFKSDGVSGIQIIETMINRRVQREFVAPLDDTGLPVTTGEAFPSLEYQQLLARGLEIIAVRIHNVVIEPFLEEQIIGNWNAEWTKVAKHEEALLNEREKLLETAAHNEALKRFVRKASEKFDNPIAIPEDVFATLQDLIEPIREVVLIESRAGNQHESEVKKRLEEVWRWLLVGKLDSKTRQRDEGKQ